MDFSINEGTLVVTGGPGDSVQTAIVIKRTPRGMSAAGAELLLLEQLFGRMSEQWTLESRHLLEVNGRVLDTFEIVLVADGDRRVIHFDVTDWLANVQSAGRRAALFV